MALYERWTDGWDGQSATPARERRGEPDGLPPPRAGGGRTGRPSHRVLSASLGVSRDAVIEG